MHSVCAIDNSTNWMVVEILSNKEESVLYGMLKRARAGCQSSKT